MPNFRGNEDLRKLDKKYLNDLLCKCGPFCLQHCKTFDISHAFLRLTIAELSMLKQVRFFGAPCIQVHEYFYSAYNENNEQYLVIKNQSLHVVAVISSLQLKYTQSAAEAYVGPIHVSDVTRETMQLDEDDPCNGRVVVRFVRERQTFQCQSPRPH